MQATSSKITSQVSTQIPDSQGRFGDYGGRYVPETLIHALDELEVEYEKACKDAACS